MFGRIIYQGQDIYEQCFPLECCQNIILGVISTLLCSVDKLVNILYLQVTRFIRDV